jgi:hypothetical protein
VFPITFYEISGTGGPGDLGIAVNRLNGRTAAFIVADIGPAGAPLGEVSIALAEALGGVNVNPRNGDGIPAGEFFYLVFPYSAGDPPWPLAPAELERDAAALLAGLGGIDAVLACADHW